MKTKISKENATKIFSDMCETFGFAVPEEAKTQKIDIAMGSSTASVVQEVDNAKISIEQIMSGQVEFDKENRKINFNLKKTIEVAGTKHNVLSLSDDADFGAFEQNGVQISELSAMMDNKSWKASLCAMCSVNEHVISKLSLNDFNCIRGFAKYFFG